MTTHSNTLIIFESATIRRVLHDGEWWFSVEDIVAALAESADPKQYIKKMRARDVVLNSNWGTICTLVGMTAADGKQRKIQAANVEGIFRLIQSIPSPKAEPFKRWLAKVGYERVQEIENPELAIKTVPHPNLLPEGEGTPSPIGRGGGEGLPFQKVRKQGIQKIPLPTSTIENARNLRKNHTDAEQKLWHALRNRQFHNLKFRRQFAYPPYILDFYCAEEKLAVELDGRQHDARQDYDTRRTAELKKRGITVLRFWNHDALHNMDGVLQVMAAHVQSTRTVPHPNLLPEGEGTLSPFGRGQSEGQSLPQEKRYFPA